MMNNLTTVPLRKQSEHLSINNSKSVTQLDIKQTVNNAFSELDKISARIDKIENKGFFKRLWGGFTGSNNRELVTSMKDLTKAQQMTIRLVLGLAVMHGQNQQSLEEILNELDNCRGIYTRSVEHIDFLYNQIELFKDQQRLLRTKNDYYCHVFRKFSENTNGFVFTWNWAAFFTGPFWFMAKGLWGWGTIILILYFVSLGLLIIPGMIFTGVVGNYIYYKDFLRI